MAQPPGMKNKNHAGFSAEKSPGHPERSLAGFAEKPLLKALRPPGNICPHLGGFSGNDLFLCKTGPAEGRHKPQWEDILPAA